MMDDKMVDAVEQSIRFVSRDGLVHPRALAETAVMTVMSVQSMTEAPPDELMYTASESVDHIESALDMERDRALRLLLDTWVTMCWCGKTETCKTCGPLENLYGQILNDPEFEGMDFEPLG